jgi:outer membrane protein OmpA-like peptidoglycan-associated protein
MIKSISTVSVIASLLLFGCAGSSVNTKALIKSQQAYEKIRQDRELAEYAPTSLFQAGKLYTLSKGAKSAQEADHLAYLLNQEIAVAKESMRAKKLEEKMTRLKEEKVKALLEAKDAQLQAAKEEAKRAKEEAQGLEQKYQELQELNAKMTNRGLVLTLGDVLFATGKATLLPGAARAIDKLAHFLAENEERKVLIEGHTDNVGSSIYNIDLSLRRALAVATALQEAGVVKSRIVIKGYGEQYPVADNSTSAGRQQNRRVEIVILNEGDRVEDIER